MFHDLVSFLLDGISPGFVEQVRVGEIAANLVRMQRANGHCGAFSPDRTRTPV